MSVRSGDLLHVETVSHGPSSLHGLDISIPDNPILAEMVADREGVILSDLSGNPGFSMRPEYAKARSWMGVPIVIGQRVIGHLEFVSSAEEQYDLQDLQRVSFQADRLAYVVENAIVFAEAARYLQQLALLNDLASAASLGIDAHEVALRVLERLRSIFHTDMARVLLLSPDEKLLLEYGTEPGQALPGKIPVQRSFANEVIRKGLPVRKGDLQWEPQEAGNSSSRAGVLSLLAVPLKYRSQVIGVLALESETSHAFSVQDEQLLVLISSHLAGLFENIRLNEEARQRARNLSMIHQVVINVVGLTGINAIANAAARLLVNDFAFDAVLILLPEQTRTFVVRQPGKAQGVDLGRNPRYPARPGVTAAVLADGKSRLVNHTGLEPGFVPSPGWTAGSEMCVALVEGKRIMGVVDVYRANPDAFNGNDLLALEAMAGVLSSVFLSARRYRQLQETVRQLQAVRETALDIAGDLDLDAVLKRVVHRARELVGVKGAELGLIDENLQVVNIHVSETPWPDYHESQVPFMAGVAGRVAAFGEPLVVGDYRSWSGRLHPEKEAPFSSAAGVPLKFQGQVIGTLVLIDDRPDWVFKDEHIQLLQLLAPQVTVWIRNARLYQELQERIQAQKVAENRLIRSARLAAVGEMAAGVAHELNNPLTTVSGFVELVLDELPADSPHRPDLELVLKESQRARGVVRRLLDFSRPVENQRVSSDLNELIGDSLALIHHLAHTGGVEICLELGEKLPWVSVDPAQIKQVLLNLGHNAIQAMPQGGSMQVSSGQASRDDHEWVYVTVSDNGVGISPENLERIFEPFFTTRPSGSGTGLGLSVSYGIVTEHAGFIEVESQPGKGSRFTVYLPRPMEGVDG
jgi:signal transduction histidine kinase